MEDSINSSKALCFGFRQNELLVKSAGATPQIPWVSEISFLDSKDRPKRFVGVFKEHPCFGLDLPEDFIAPSGMTFTGLRGLFGVLPDELFFLAGRAFQMVQFEKNHRFCGRCGSITDFKKDEYAVICPACNLIRYPCVSPAVIVAVVKGRHILLARSPRFPKGRYSVLAGFVEPGETLEACVQREVREEARVEVRNIRYFSSQPWPFPNSLMVGFTAEYAGGNILIDNHEILEADWFSADALPDVPARPTIARKLIDWFVQTRSD